MATFRCRDSERPLHRATSFSHQTPRASVSAPERPRPRHMTSFNKHRLHTHPAHIGCGGTYGLRRQTWAAAAHAGCGGRHGLRRHTWAAAAHTGCGGTHGLRRHTWAAAAHLGCGGTHGLRRHTWAAAAHMGCGGTHGLRGTIHSNTRSWWLVMIGSRQYAGCGGTILRHSDAYVCKYAAAQSFEQLRRREYSAMLQLLRFRIHIAGAPRRVCSRRTPPGI